MPDEINHNSAGEVAPSTVDQQAPSVSEDNAPSTSSDQATSIPSANAPDPETAGSSNVNTAKPKAEAKTKVVAKTEEADAKAVKPKKEKAPALEDKPFADFIQQDYLPAVQKAMEVQGVQDLHLSFEKAKIPIAGFKDQPECWQVIGRWQGGKRQFNVYFLKDDIQGQRGFSYATNGGRPSTMEPFLIDERKITLDLLVFGLLQRLNGQKWLVRN